MTANAGAAVPSARALRRWLTQARRRHRVRPRGETFNDVYMALWVFVVYGWVALDALRSYTAGAVLSPEAAAQRVWLGGAALLAAAGAFWAGLRAVGPLVVDGPERSWCLSTPVDRAGWLRPRLALALVVGVAAALTVLLPVGLLATGAALAPTAAAAAVWGPALVAAGVVAQAAPPRGGWPRWPAPVLVGAATAVAACVPLASALEFTLPRPPRAPAWAGVGVGLAVATLAVARAAPALGRLDRRALSRGAALAGAAGAAVIALDASILTEMMAARHWRSRGPVRSRALPRGTGRTGALIRAEVRRLGRRRAILPVAAGAALVQYAVATVFPALAPATQLVAAWVVGLHLAGGLHTVVRSPGLRRALGGSDVQLHLTHLAIPAVGLTLWWLATLPAAGAAPDVPDALWVAGVVGAVYRTVTRPPMRYDDVAVESPFGTLPTGTLVQMARGFDVVAGLVLIRTLLGA